MDPTDILKAAGGVLLTRDVLARGSSEAGIRRAIRRAGMAAHGAAAIAAAPPPEIDAADAAAAVPALTPVHK